jgi:predicted 3-demethylubiquinone-9 3-methyltransferase (glyoxalase superfamily)
MSGETMQKIVPHLWFDSSAQEAAEYYVSVFNDAKILNIARYPEAAEEVSGKTPGSVMTVEFEIEGQRFLALNGGKIPGFEFTPAISFLINCETQEEIDRLWEKLSAVPEAEQCGWCQDKFGITWQVVPTLLSQLLSDSDKAKVERVTGAFLKMKKFDIAALQAAYDQ